MQIIKQDTITTPTHHHFFVQIRQDGEYKSAIVPYANDSKPLVEQKMHDALEMAKQVKSVCNHTCF